VVKATTIPARLSARQLAKLFELEPAKIKLIARHGYCAKARRKRYSTVEVLKGLISIC
jgi:hypothetical protein